MAAQEIQCFVSKQMETYPQSRLLDIYKSLANMLSVILLSIVRLIGHTIGLWRKVSSKMKSNPLLKNVKLCS